MVLASVVLGIVSIIGNPIAAKANCNTYYVSSSGNDSNLGTIDSPWLSIHKSAKKLSPCDTLYVRSGIYNQSGIVLYNMGT